MGNKIYIKKEPSRVRPKNSEVDRLCLLIKKANKIYKWKPKFASKKGFEMGLKKQLIGSK